MGEPTSDQVMVTSSRESEESEEIRDEHIVDEKQKSESSFCNLCGKSSEYKRNMTRHMATCAQRQLNKLMELAGMKSRDKNLICKVCRKEFSRKAHLRRHLLHHLKVKKELCSICGKSFTQKAHLKRHLEVHNATCEVCNLKFDSKVLLRLHIKNSHGSSVKHDGNLTDDANVISFAAQQELIAKGQLGEQAEGSHTCITCGRAFKQKCDLDNHAGTHSADLGRFLCVVCEPQRRFAQRTQMDRHLAKNHPPPDIFTCQLCQPALRTFESASQLNGHANVLHRFERSALCKYCSCLLKEANYLDHVCYARIFYCPREIAVSIMLILPPPSQPQATEPSPIHPGPPSPGFSPSPINLSNNNAGECSPEGSTTSGGEKCGGRKKTYSCDECPAGFGSKMELEEHQNSHTGNKPFECEVCNARFNRRSTLWNHKRIHSDHKPFTCPVCQLKFKWKNSLKCHKEMHLRKNETGPIDPTVLRQEVGVPGKRGRLKNSGGTGGQKRGSKRSGAAAGLIDSGPPIVSSSVEGSPSGSSLGTATPDFEHQHLQHHHLLPNPHHSLSLPGAHLTDPHALLSHQAPQLEFYSNPHLHHQHQVLLANGQHGLGPPMSKEPTTNGSILQQALANSNGGLQHPHHQVHQTPHLNGFLPPHPGLQQHQHPNNLHYQGGQGHEILNEARNVSGRQNGHPQPPMSNNNNNTSVATAVTIYGGAIPTSTITLQYLGTQPLSTVPSVSRQSIIQNVGGGGGVTSTTASTLKSPSTPQTASNLLYANHLYDPYQVQGHTPAPPTNAPRSVGGTDSYMPNVDIMQTTCNGGVSSAAGSTQQHQFTFDTAPGGRTATSASIENGYMVRELQHYEW